MTEQEQYDALIAQLYTGSYNGHPLNGWVIDNDLTTITVTVGYADSTPNDTFTFDATQVHQ
jgi:hypothetical protein